MRCPLCTRRAGALKPSLLSTKSNFFERLNPEYHSYLKSLASTSRLKRDNALLGQKTLPEDAQNDKMRSDSVDVKLLLSQDQDEVDEETSGKYEEDLYYDYHSLRDESVGIDLQNEPKPDFVWTHITCALFIPELHFRDSSSLTDITGKYWSNVRS